MKLQLGKIITQLMILDLFVVLSAYTLQILNPRLIWVFIIAIILLFWLSIAKVLHTFEIWTH